MQKNNLYSKIDYYLNQSIFIYKKAVSESFEVLGAAPLVAEISKLVDGPLSIVDMEEATKIALFKFNKLVVPYLDMEPVSDIKIIDGFEFYLHDLIHEAIKPGSVKSFNERDEDKTVRWQSNYSLQEYLEEDIAEYLTSRRYDNGLAAYLENLVYKIPNISNIKTKENLLAVIEMILNKDIQSIEDSNQKKFLETFKKFVLNSIKNNKINLASAKTISEQKTFIRQIMHDVLVEFEYKQFYKKKHKSGQTSKLLTNERVASLIRRWLTALKKDIEELINKKMKEY